MRSSEEVPERVHCVLKNGINTQRGDSPLPSPAALDAHFRKEGRQIRIDMPENGQQIRIPFAARADAAVMGTLADKAQGGGDLEGIMFTSNFQTRVVGEDDLEKYTSLRVGKVKAKLHVPYTGTKDTLLLFLSEVSA